MKVATHYAQLQHEQQDLTRYNEKSRSVYKWLRIILDTYKIIRIGHSDGMPSVSFLNTELTKTHTSYASQKKTVKKSTRSVLYI